MAERTAGGIRKGAMILCEERPRRRVSSLRRAAGNRCRRCQCPFFAVDQAEKPHCGPPEAISARLESLRQRTEGDPMSRIVTIAAVLAALMIVGTPAHACDSNYPWLCKPVPSIDPPESAAEPAKPAAKPLEIANRRGAARTAVAAKASKSSIYNSRKSTARKATARRWAERSRRAKAAAARKLIETSAKAEPTEAFRAVTTASPEPRRKPAVVSAAAPATEAAAGSSPGFAGMWAERSTAAAEPLPAVAAAEPGQPASEPAPAQPEPAVSQHPVSQHPVSQHEVNEIDLAAAEPLATPDSSWMRSLFIAFGGLLAVGSALRLFI
jgi:hypothetical protein